MVRLTHLSVSYTHLDVYKRQEENTVYMTGPAKVSFTGKIEV